MTLLMNTIIMGYQKWVHSLQKKERAIKNELTM